MKKGFRIAVGIMIIDKDKNIYLFERSDLENTWQCPEGGLGAGENALDGAMRELNEEVRIKKEDVNVIAETKEYIPYIFTDSFIDKKTGEWKNTTNKKGYIGQQKKFFLVEFNGDEKTIHFDEYPEEIEFRSFKKVKKDNFLNELNSDFKKDMYKTVLDEFKSFL